MWHPLAVTPALLLTLALVGSPTDATAKGTSGACLQPSRLGIVGGIAGALVGGVVLGGGTALLGNLALAKCDGGGFCEGQAGILFFAPVAAVGGVVVGSVVGYAVGAVIEPDDEASGHLTTPPQP